MIMDEDTGTEVSPARWLTAKLNTMFGIGANSETFAAVERVAQQTIDAAKGVPPKTYKTRPVEEYAKEAALEWFHKAPLEGTELHRVYVDIVKRAIMAAIEERDAIIESQLCAGCDTGIAKKYREELVSTADWLDAQDSCAAVEVAKRIREVLDDTQDV